jgi:hypothetical protein
MLRNLSTDTAGAIGPLNPENYKSLLRHDLLHAPHEEAVWLNVVRWVEYDPESRVKEVPQILQILRLGMMHPDFLLQVMNS